MTTQLELPMRGVHEHSVAVYHEDRATSMSQRAKLIYEWLLDRGSATDREVCEGLDLPDMNCVRPRITELIVRGSLRECGERVDHITNKTVRVVEVSE